MASDHPFLSGHHLWCNHPLRFNYTTNVLSRSRSFSVPPPVDSILDYDCSRFGIRVGEKERFSMTRDVS